MDNPSVQSPRLAAARRLPPALGSLVLVMSLIASLAPAREGAPRLIEPASANHPPRSYTTTFAADVRALATNAHEGLVVEGSFLELEAGRASAATDTARVQGRELFDRLCVSLDALTPGTSSVEVRARVELEDTLKTDWLSLGFVGASNVEVKLPRSVPGPKDGPAKVAIDTIELAPAGNGSPRGRAFEVRLVLTRGAGGETPKVQRVAAVAWPHGVRETNPEWTERGDVHGAWGKALVVPERSQCVEDPKIRGRICSPTSLGMVLAYHGVALLTSEVATHVLDHESGIYGNWAFNVAFAGQLGFRAEIARCESFEPVEAEIAAGRPVVISHRWSEGELTGAPVRSTDGHLIVIRGFTAEGDVEVNDPAADPRKGDKIARVYSRSELRHTWLERGDGVAYFIRKWQ